MSQDEFGESEDDLIAYGDVGDVYKRHSDAVGHPEHPNFARFLAELQKFAEAGWAEAAQALGEELSKPGTGFKPDQAYKWYYIGLSLDGYNVDWNDTNHSPPYYCGPAGDFRNEAIVSDLVVLLGWERVHELDDEAAQWLADHDLTPET